MPKRSDNKNVTSRAAMGGFLGVIIVWLIETIFHTSTGEPLRVPAEVAVAVGSVLSWAAWRFIPERKYS